MSGRHVAYYNVTAEFLHEIVAALSNSKVPADAVVLRVDFDSLTNCIRVLIEHPSFVTYPEGSVPPRLDYYTTSKYRNAIDCAAATMRLTT